MTLLDELRAAVGDRHCLTDPDLRAPHEIDWTGRYRGRALAIVRPGSAEEVAAILRACAESGIGVVTQGGNTGLVGGSVPRDGEVVVSLSRMADIEPVDGVGGEVTVGAGATLSAVQAHARAAGWEVGVDLGARDSATIGGMVATNAGGVHVLRHGPMRRQVIGLEAVTSTGSVLRRLPGMLKDNTGYDLAGLLAGSEGTLAVITRVRLRLVPPLPHRAVALLGLADAATVIAVAGDLRRRLPSLLAAELVTREGLDLVLRHAQLEPPFATPFPAYLLVETASAHGDPLDVLAAALEDFDASDVAVATDAAGRHRLWQLRERHTEAVNAEGVPHKLDVSVPIACLAELVDRVGPAVYEVAPDAQVISYGHVGDGNLHVNVLGPPPDDHAVDDAVLELVLSLGGSISAEHGIGVAKARWLVRDRGEADVAAMRAVKRALDPAGVMNPGVIFPLDG